MHKQTTVNKIYDPAAGSGSLLLQAKKHFDAHIVEDGFFGQEINHTTFNLARMNMFLHGIEDFEILRGDTLRHAAFFEVDGLNTYDRAIANPMPREEPVIRARRPFNPKSGAGWFMRRNHRLTSDRTGERGVFRW